MTIKSNTCTYHDYTQYSHLRQVLLVLCLLPFIFHPFFVIAVNGISYHQHQFYYPTFIQRGGGVPKEVDEDEENKNDFINKNNDNSSNNDKDFPNINNNNNNKTAKSDSVVSTKDNLLTPSSNNKRIISISSIQGKRQYMEDEYFTNQDGSFVAVFDGHGGKAISRYLRQNLYARYLQAKATTINFIPSRSLQQDNDHDIQNENDSDIDKCDDGGVKTEEQLQRVGEENTKRILSNKLLSSSSPTPFKDVNSTCADIKDNGKESDYNDSDETIEYYIQALSSAFKTVDSEINRISHWSYQGSTAVAVLLCQLPSSFCLGGDQTGFNKDRTVLISANVGDSRAVLSRSGKAIDLTTDHKPNNPSERKRIESLGGTVKWCGPVHPKTGEPIINSSPRNSNGGSLSSRRGVAGVYRINGNLALSRAIGDRSEKPLVCSEVEIKQIELDHDRDEFVIIASDGLWVSLSSESIYSFYVYISECSHF